MLDTLLSAGVALHTLILWVLGVVVIGAVTLWNDRREMRSWTVDDDES